MHDSLHSAHDEELQCLLVHVLCLQEIKVSSIRLGVGVALVKLGVGVAFWGMVWLVMVGMEVFHVIIR